MDDWTKDLKKELVYDWYAENIEEPITPLVRLLRDNGFNTECSCGHKMYVQCQYFLDGRLRKLDELLFNNGYREYTIEMIIQRVNGFTCPSPSFTIHIKTKESGDDFLSVYSP